MHYTGQGSRDGNGAITRRLACFVDTMVGVLCRSVGPVGPCGPWDLRLHVRILRGAIIDPALEKIVREGLFLRSDLGKKNYGEQLSF